MAPAGGNSSEPQLTASGDDLILSWIERAGPATTLKFAERTDSGWTVPVTAASGADWFISYADPPAVMRLSNGTLVAQWLQHIDPRIEAMDLKMSYSTDRGKTWAPPFSPHHDGTTTQHAFASMFELPGSTLGLVWLDGRESFAETDDPAGGAMTLRYAAFDAAWTQRADAAVDLRVCECCSTSAAMTSDGVLAGFRDRSAGEIRDIAVSRLENGRWSPASLVHDDGWKTYSCPVNGPALSARGRRVVAGWFTAVSGDGHAYAAFSNDAGRTWGAPIQLDAAAALGHVDVELLEDGAAVATWLELVDGRGQLRLRRIDPAGARSGPVSVTGMDGGRAAGPRLARYRNELVFAWTDSGPAAEGDTAAQTIRTATAPLPGH
jgi:hypothetical protein